MEAVSRGAAEGGGHVVGITCDEIECWRAVKANPWVQEERRFATIRQRLFALIEGCDAALALPGGVGTLAEVSVMWNHMQTEALPLRPLVLIGQGWQEVIGTLWRVFEPHIPIQHRSLLTFARDIEEAISFINIHR
jgi:predicted Rossmann-fold nucleotide-binding protein